MREMLHALVFCILLFGGLGFFVVFLLLWGSVCTKEGGFIALKAAML